MNSLDRAAEAISDSKFILISAGAGMGVDSGLPDFRGDQGFWRAYPALRGFSFSDMANPRWFETDPSRAWGFYGHRLNLYRSTQPHQGFQILKQWSQNRQTFVFTSNVDGQFQKAGFPEERILECHGSIHWLQSIQPQSNSKIWSAADVTVSVDEANVRAIGPLPTDPSTGLLARPNVLMFGDWSWLHSRCARQEERFAQFVQKACQNLNSWVVIEMGAGSSVPTVRLQSEKCMKMGASLIRINPRECEGPNGIISIKNSALSALLAINDRLRNIG